MILAVRCDQPKFKTVVFGNGFNAIVAEKTEESSDKDSRNGLGKTTLIEIIHFCLGARTRKNRGLLKKQLDNWTFALDVRLRGHNYTVSRNTSKPGRVIIEGDWSDWPIKPKVDRKTGLAAMAMKEWNIVLGWLIFDIPVADDGTDEQYMPSFRGIVSYFARRGRDAFSTPFEHYRKQKAWEKQIDNTFLLGLGWEHAQQWQLIKDKQKALKELKKAASADFMPNLVGSIGKLETEKIRLETEISKEKCQLDAFNVHPQYHDIEERANSLTATIHRVANENYKDRRLMETYQSSIREEKPADTGLVRKIYFEIGLVFPEIVIKRLEDVQSFHTKITANRREFLTAEINRLASNIATNEEDIQASSEERSRLMRVLETHGALEEYMRLQEIHLSKATKLESIKQRIDGLRKLEEAKSSGQIEQARLHLAAIADHEKRHKALQDAVSIFNANSEALYQVPG